MAEKRVRYIVDAEGRFDPTFDRFSARMAESEAGFESLESAAGVSMDRIQLAQQATAAGFDRLTDGARRCADALGQAGTAGADGLGRVGATAEKVGEAVGKTATELHDVYAETKRESPMVATALGIAFAVFLGGTLLGAIYAVYKALTVTFGFLAGLVTGESYDNKYVKDFLALNDTLKTTQKELGVTAERASALEDAAARSGKSASALTSAQSNLEKAVDAAGKELNDSNHSLADMAKYQVAVATAVATFTPEIKKQEAVIADSYQRMADYGLLVTERHQQAAAEFEESSRIFKRESELTARGFKSAISDAIMPILGDLQSFFAEGFPTTVRAFRSTIGILTALFYGLKTSIYSVAEVLLSVVEISATSFATLGMAAAQALTGNYAASLKTIEEGKTAVAARWQEMQDNIVAQATRSRDRIELALGFKISDADNLFMPLAKGAEATGIKVKTAFDSGKEGIKEAKDVAEDLRTSLEKELARLNAVAQQESKLTEVGIELQKEKYKELLPAQKQELLNLAGLIDKKKEELRLTKMLAEEHQKDLDFMARHGDALADVTGKLEDANDALELEVSLIGKSRLEKELLILADQKRAALAKDASAQYQRDIELLYARREALLRNKDAAEEALGTSVDMVKSMDEAGRATLAAFGDDKANVIKRFGAALKSSVLDLLWQITGRKWLIDIGASMTGTSSQAFAQAAGMNTNSPLGGMNSLLNSATVGGTVFGNAGAYAAMVPGLTATGAGSQAAMLAAQTGEFGLAGLTSTASAGGSGLMAGLAAAGPWIAAAIAIYAIAQALQKPGGPKEGGSFLGQYDVAGVLTNGRASVPGSDNGRFYTPSSRDAELESIGTATARGFYDTLRSLGGTSRGALAFGIGYDTDPRGTAPNRISSGVYDATGRRLFGSQDRAIGRESAEIGPQLQLESKRMILAALQASDLPEEIAGLINRLSPQTATGEEIDATLTLASRFQAALGGVQDAIDSLSGDSLEIFKRQLNSLRDAVTDARGALEDALKGDNAQAVADAQDALMSAVLDRYNAEMQMVAELSEAVRGLQQESYNFRLQMAQRIVGAGGTRDIAGMAWGRSQDIMGGLGSITDPRARVAAINDAVGALDTWFQEQQAAIMRNAEAAAAAAQAVAAAQASARQAEIAGLQQQLQLSQQWVGVLNQAQQMMDAMRYTGVNPLSAAARLSFATNDSDSLLEQFRSMSGQGKIDAANKLLPLLQTRLGLLGETYQRPGLEYEGGFNEISAALAEVSGYAQTEAQRALVLQSRIADLQATANSYAASTADASAFAAAELQALNEQYRTQAEQMEAAGIAAYEQAERTAREQLEAVTGGVSVELYSATRLTETVDELRGLRSDVREFLTRLTTGQGAGGGAGGSGSGSGGTGGGIGSGGNGTSIELEIPVVLDGREVGRAMTKIVRNEIANSSRLINENT